MLNKHNRPQPIGVIALIFNRNKIINWAIVSILTLLGLGLATQAISLETAATEIPPAPAISQGGGDNANSLIFSITDRTHSTFHVYDEADNTFESCQKPDIPLPSYYETLYKASPTVINAEDVKNNGAEPVLEDARESHEYQVEKDDDSKNVCIRVTWGDDREDSSASPYFYGPYSFETGKLVRANEEPPERTPEEETGTTPEEQDTLEDGSGGQNREVIDPNASNDQEEIIVVSAPLTDNEPSEDLLQRVAENDPPLRDEEISDLGILDDNKPSWSQTLGILILTIAVLGALRIILVKKLKRSRSYDSYESLN